MSKGLSFDYICGKALSMIDERGFEGFSLTALAAELGVKTASLYNYIGSLGELLTEVGARAADMMNAAAENEMRGKTRLDALMALAFSLWEYAKQHPGLYHLMVRGTMDISEDIKGEAKRVIEPIAEALRGYGLTEGQRIHWIRLIRSFGYGFILHAQGSAFSAEEYPKAETYRMGVMLIDEALCKIERENTVNKNF